MEILAGTSGFSYKEWKGRFYPDSLPNAEMLSYYSRRLPSVEINNTFYRLPRESVVEGWAEQVPAGFRFVIKASRRITHFKRLKEAEDETGYLLRTVGLLGDRLGAVLFQLPPNLKQDLERLETFLSGLADPGAAWGYLRLRKADYSDAALAEWAARVGGAGWEKAFVFFKHEDDGAGPRMAERFLELV
jgi:uncharacterized protein YecE (DUF72 family)